MEELMEGDSDSETFSSTNSIGEPSHEPRSHKPKPQKTQSAIALVPYRKLSNHTPRVEGSGGSIGRKTEGLRNIINSALGHLSELIRKIRLLEKKKNSFQHQRIQRNQTYPPDNLVAFDTQRLIEDLETERDELSEALAYWQDQCNQLTTYSNNLVDDIQRLQTTLDIQSENELIEQFYQLCYNIKSCSDNFYQKSDGKHTLGKTESRRIISSIGLDPSSDRYLLKTSSGRKYLSQAYLSRMLVSRVFHNEEERGQIKDLWASESTARDLAAIEGRMKGIDLPPEEFNKWRCMTVRNLSRNPLENNVRVEMLIDELLQVLLGIFGITKDSPSASELRKASLEDPIVIKAVELSQSLRKQPSDISVSIDSSQSHNDILSIVGEGGRPPEGGGEEFTRLEISPAMIRNTDEHGAKATRTCTLVYSRHAFQRRFKNREMEDH